jgi:hypothetical protein
MEKDQNYYEQLDKRTKEYKEWKEKRDAAPKGLGDSVQQVTKATGIEKAVKFLAGEDCGCDKRRDTLNKIFRYRQPKCFTEEEYTYLAELFSSKSNKVSGNRLIKIYNRVFTANKTPTQCSPCIKKVYDELKLYFDKYDG